MIVGVGVTDQLFDHGSHQGRRVVALRKDLSLTDWRSLLAVQTYVEVFQLRLI